MQSHWSEADAAAAVKKYVSAGINKDVAIRVYTTRLLGQDPTLVLHGGGNTSVKTRVEDADGSLVEVLCVKGSGWETWAPSHRAACRRCGSSRCKRWRSSKNSPTTTW